MRNKSVSKRSLGFDPRALGAVVGLTLSLSCGDAESHAPTQEDAVLAAQASRSVRVRATGSGCPSNGTWDARVREGGAQIEVTFLRFSAELEAADGEVLRGCELQVSLASGEALQYAPAALEVSGRADAASLTTRIAWASSPADGKTISSALESEFYENYAFDTLWSPCGTSQELRVSLDARVPRGSFKLDGSTLSLTRRACEPAQDGGGAATPDASEPVVDAGGITPQGPDASTGSPDGAVEIGTPTTTGPGCGAVTVVSPVKPDGTGLVLRFAGLSGKRNLAASCNITIPSGSATKEVYAISAVSVKGTASLQQDMTGVVSLTPRVQGVGPVAEGREVFTGPTTDPFAFIKAFAGKDLGFGPCGRVRTLQLALSLGVSDADPTEGRVGAVDVSEVTIDFARKSCAN